MATKALKVADHLVGGRHLLTPVYFGPKIKFLFVTNLFTLPLFFFNGELN